MAVGRDEQGRALDVESRPNEARHPAAVLRPPSAVEFETDVVVIGAGGCGLTAAITAATLAPGLQIALLEKNSRVTSNSAIAGGYLQAAGTRFQRAAGIEDSPEQLAEDIRRKNGGRSDPEWTLALCRTATDVIHWMADEIRIPIELAPEAWFPGHSVHRMHGHPTRSGAPLVAALREHAATLSNVLYADNTSARALYVDEAGRVVGVEAGEGETVQRIRCRCVVIASGGFGADRELIGRFIPALSDAPYMGSQSNTGEALRWGLALGAAVEHLPGHQGFGYWLPSFGTRITPTVVNAGGIMVNRLGQRFVREDLGPSEMGEIVLSQPDGVAVCVWDEPSHQAYGNSHSIRESERVGAITRFDSLTLLACHFHLDEDALARTIDAYNQGIAERRDALGRRLPEQPLAPPFYAALVTGALAHTQGGLKVDVHGRVLFPDGSPIPNLYAGGGAAAGISGDRADGYLPGNGLMHAYALGRLIGEHVAASLLE
ncbi:MAG: FAD-dependent oxidoreductase [Chloroflexi bacterium]|nr:FAD-dependent oxidoreductase [Chloroflexota bacterium]